MNKLFLTFTCVLLLTACGDTGRESSVQGHRTSNNPQKVISEKVQQEALKAGTLLEIQPQSLVISEITASEVKLGLRFLLNQQNGIGFRKYAFNIRNTEELTIDNSQFDLTPESRLKIELYRFKGAQGKDHLSVHFQFENRAGVEGAKGSSLVIMVELSKNQKAPIKTNFYYPTSEGFNLKKWSEALVKDSQPQ